MKRVTKYLCITAVGMPLLLAIGGWGTNRWLQTAGGRALIESRLGKSLRMPVKLQTLTFSVWSGLTADGVSVPGPSGDVFHAAKISVGHRLASILMGRLAFSEVRIEQPKFRLVQEASGEWRLPQNPPTPPVASSVAAAAPANPAAPAKKLHFSIGHVSLNGGSAELLDAQHAPLANLSGLAVTLNDVTELGFTGSFEADRVTLHRYGAAEHITGLVTQKDKETQVRNFAATIGGGSVAAEASRAQGATAAVSLRFGQINLLQAAQAAGVTSPKLAGIISGDAQLAGLGSDAKAITGSGSLAFKDGMCREIELIRQIGDVLQLQSLSNFEIAEAKVQFRLADERVVIAPMTVSAPPLAMDVTGAATFDGMLDLSVVLLAPADFINQRTLIANQFSPPDQNNRRGVQFNITGPLRKPKNNLAERVTGTDDKRQQRIIVGGTAVTTLLENTPIGKRNPKLMKLLPQLIPVRPGPQPAPATPVPAQQ